ncbi:hypothetical protein GALL_548360 [mine drainage metagenome]|uniref:Uncharacterized protein n=1 Tax=mine drainage metagenome TaxID=410659 RepID=A0A1J5NXX3_9ZZZZ
MATDEVQSRPTVPPDMRKFTIASSSSTRLGMQLAMSADSFSTSCPVTKLAMCIEWMPQSANCAETPACAGS